MRYDIGFKGDIPVSVVCKRDGRYTTREEAITAAVEQINRLVFDVFEGWSFFMPLYKEIIDATRLHKSTKA